MSNQLKPMQAITAKEMDALLSRIKDNRIPPIRNYRNNPGQGQIGIPRTDGPMVLDFGIKINTRKEQRPLSAEECNRLFGIAGAVKMNFIPQMLNALMMEQASLLVNYCKDNRVYETKKHTRVIRAAVEEYAAKLRESYGEREFRSYAYYAERFMDETTTDIYLMEIHADALCRNQVPDRRHYPIFVRTLVIVMLIRFCQRYDREMDKLIESRLNQPVRQQKDIYQQSILAMCLSLAEDLGYKINPDKVMGDWVKVLSNKANRLADTILDEEGLVKRQ